MFIIILYVTDKKNKYPSIKNVYCLECCVYAKVNNNIYVHTTLQFECYATIQKME